MEVHQEKLKFVIFYRKEKFTIENSSYLPVTTDNISGTFLDAIFEAKNLSDNTYFTLVDLTSHTQQNLLQNKEITIPHFNCSFKDAFKNHIKSFMKEFLMGAIAFLRQ